VIDKLVMLTSVPLVSQYNKEITHLKTNEETRHNIECNNRNKP